MKTERGQSLVEIIFAIGVIAVVIVGVISLMVNVIGIKTTSLKRKRATEMGNVVVEELLQKKMLNPDEFWDLVPITGGTLPGFEQYSYNVGFSQVVIPDHSCRSSVNDCVNAIIDIFWDSGGSSLSVTRFFSRRG